LKTSATKLTVARAVFGTPEFMAPEQAEGRQDAIDHRSDQWSLACLAWFSLTACLPFSGPDVNAILNQVISADPTPVAPGSPRVSAEVDQVLRRALSKDRADRFPTIRAFARAFEAAASGVSPDAAPNRRTPLAVEAAQRPALEAREPGQGRPRRRRGVRTWLATIAVLAILILGGVGWLLRDQPPVSTWLRQARTLVDRH